VVLWWVSSFIREGAMCAFGSRVLTMGFVVGHLPCFWAGSAPTGTPLRGVVALIFHRGVADVWHLWLTKSDDFRPGCGLGVVWGAPVCEPACEPAYGSRVLTMGSVVDQVR
jgi:hypothetical protein